ncbi:UPF0489 family protein [Desulfotalea psychrophila]|nr:UPF0489 family protein [Desulfotalea psychrophila]
MKTFDDYIVNSDDFCKEIYPNVWLMDDHKWAFWAWISYIDRVKTSLPLSLYHIDYHWDAINDFQCEKALSDISQAELTALFSLVSEDYISKDGFIAPAIIKRIFDEVHFYCRQKGTEIAFSPDFLKTYNAKQYIHQEIENMCAVKKSKQYAFDLDIDVFNDSGMYLESELWSQEKRDLFFQKCRGLIENASVITIAMSFGYSGTKNDTKYLAKYVIKKYSK